MRLLLEHRAWVSGVVAGVAGFLARAVFPWRSNDPMLALVAVYQPTVYNALYVGYVTLLFTTPYLLTSVVGALAYIFVRGRQPHGDAGPLPPYPDPATRESLFVVLGEHPELTPFQLKSVLYLTATNVIGSR